MCYGVGDGPVLGRVRELLRQVALETLSPTRCAGCERPGTLLCDECLARLALIDPVFSCIRCAAPFGSVLCTECDRPATAGEGRSGERVGPPGRVLATAVFADPLPRIIRAYKDGGERRLAPLLAELLLDTALHAEAAAPERYGGILSGADAVTFVPATARAFGRRGFDHMEAVARALAELWGIPLVDALVKHGGSDQRGLGRAARAMTSRGVYEVVADVRGARLLLVDDVITTGATLRSSAAALATAGAACVDALAAARVW